MLAAWFVKIVLLPSRRIPFKEIPEEVTFACENPVKDVNNNRKRIIFFISIYSIGLNLNDVIHAKIHWPRLSTETSRGRASSHSACYGKGMGVRACRISTQHP